MVTFPHCISSLRSFRVGDQEVGLDPQGHRNGLTGPVNYVQVDDIHKSLPLLLDAGAQTQQEIHDSTFVFSCDKFGINLVSYK